MKCASALLLLVVMAPGGGPCGAAPAAPAPLALATVMREARHSQGFALRMNITVVSADGRPLAPLKLAVIGQSGRERERLLIRGIAPAAVRNRVIAAERGADGEIRAVIDGTSGGGRPVPADPFMTLFDSGLVLWDLFGPWWGWPIQTLGDTQRLGGHDCIGIRSRTDAGTAVIREVESCIDRADRLALRTQLYDDRRTLIRTISVEESMHYEVGAVAARRLSIAGADQALTEIEVYSADPHYAIAADTFAVLDAAAAAGDSRP
jgi:hypothetical protein